VSTATITAPAPPVVDRLARRALMVGAGAGLLTVAGALFSPAQFFRSYLFGFLFWIDIAVGCLSLALIHNLTGGMWGLAIRRILEAGTRTLPWMALLFLPLAFGLPQVYEWARPEALQDDLLRKKALYLNRGFFLLRAAFYFGVWALLAHFQDRWSREQDQGPSRRLERRLRGLGGAGLLLMGLTITFSAVDWAMSLDPHWFSTVYGILFMVGQVLSAMALVIVMVAVLGAEDPLARVVDRTVVHDLGKLLLAFVMLWAYIMFSQFLIIWSANLPEETPWYIRRLHGGWQWLALLLVVFHFVLPFLLLLSRTLKRQPGKLAAVAIGLLGVRLIELYWLVGPDLQGHGTGHGSGLSLHWQDPAAVATVGGLWLWLFARELRARPLLPLGEPEIRERLETAHG
jgi:hypothetical protein